MGIPRISLYFFYNLFSTLQCIPYRSLHNVCFADSFEETGTNDNRMAQGLETMTGPQELSIQTVLFRKMYYLIHHGT